MLPHDLAFYMADEQAFNQLTEEQVMALSRGETVELPVDGDTAAKPAESESAPALAAEPVVEAAKEVEPVLLAKDGKHTIPFQRLKDAEARAAEWEAVAASKDELIKSLQQAQIEDAKTGTTEAQDAVLAEYQGEFPEVANDLKPYIQSLIDAGIKAGTSELKEKLNSALAPMQKDAEAAALDEHFAVITGAIPDFEALVKSDAVGNWIKTQPSFMQAPSLAILEKGTAAEVIELFTAYKAAQGTLKDVTATPSKEELKKQAEAVIAGAKGKTPVSLSDIPSGVAAEINEIAAEANMNASQLYAKFQNMPPDKILKHASRVA